MLNWELATTELDRGDSFTVTARMFGNHSVGEHGGMSVSFPSLTQPGGSKNSHSSSDADVKVVDYTTGTSNVTFHQAGATIHHKVDNKQFPAEYLLVESDDASWPTSSDRTLRLRVTPKVAGDFEIQIRGWLCADGYTQCDRVPETGSLADQQGWVVVQITVRVEPSSTSYSDPPPVDAVTFLTRPSVYAATPERAWRWIASRGHQFILRSSARMLQLLNLQPVHF